MSLAEQITERLAAYNAAIFSVATAEPDGKVAAWRAAENTRLELEALFRRWERGER